MKVFKKLLIPILLFSSIFTIAGCGKKEDKKKTTDVVTHKEAKGKIGKDGGEVKDSENNVSLNIPKDALSKDTEITIRYISSEQEIDDNPNINFLGAVEYGPSGTVFDKEVEAKVKLTKVPTNSTVSVFCYDEVNKVWDYVTSATVKDGVATCKITHFSRYEYLDLSSAMKDKYESLVNQAISEGKSDEWITLTYYDYLVDECHVLDYYPNYEGYYYYGCGLKIFGNYQVDGKTGNSEDLSLVWGESNKVGNTYGYSTLGGKTSSYNDYKENAAKTTDKVSGSSVTVVIEYKIITPQFTMSASKTKLNKGESADVSLYCHFFNSTNKLHQDFPLDDYYLSLTSSSSNFSIDKTSVVTNNAGKATFKVTCNKSGEKAVVKAIFDVAGDFGTHAEGIIHFGSEDKFVISGHVVDVKEYTYRLDVSRQIERGKYYLKVEYDIEGRFGLGEEGYLVGTLKAKNVNVTLNTAPNKYYRSIDETDMTISDYWYFYEKQISTKETEEIPIYVDIVDGKFDVNAYGSGVDDIVIANGTGETASFTGGSLEGTLPSTIKIECMFRRLFKDNLEEATNTAIDTELSVRVTEETDPYTFHFGGMYDYTEKSTQTITISREDSE